jgi:carotenoid cleavage dioxygenase-like enzyme
LAKAKDALLSAFAHQQSNGVRQSAIPVNAPHLGAMGNAKEVFGVKAELIEGALPPGIRGALVRNGPGLVEAGNVLDGTNTRVPHWFDGLGGLLRADLDGRNGTVTIDYRFIRTKRYQDYQASDGNQFSQPGFGLLPEGDIFKRSLLNVSSAVNTNYLQLSEGLAVGLDETGLPMRIDPQTLETLGEFDFGGRLGLGARFTAHPKRDDVTGNLFALSTSIGPGGGTSVLEVSPRGELLRQLKIPGMKMPPHDFVDAGEVLVFIENPVKLDMLSGVLGLKSISESITWVDGEEAKVHIVDKRHMQLIAQGSGKAFSSSHFGAGRVENDGSISFITFVSPQNDPGGRELVALMKGENLDVGLRPTRIHVDRETGDIVRIVPLADVHGEWPVTDPGGSGLWFSRRTGDSTYFNGYAYLDGKTGEITDALELPPGTFGDELTLVVDAENPKQRWLLSPQYVSGSHESQLVIYDADHLKNGAVARFRLPEVVPFAFHGSFFPAAQPR